MSEQSRLSFAWAHFDRDTTGQSATCKKCSAKIKCSGGSTSGLKRHLKSKHNIVEEGTPQGKQDSSLADAGSSSSSSGTAAALRGGHGIKRSAIDKISSQKQEKITKYASKISGVQEDVAKMMAIDGFSANQIAKSNFIKEAFYLKGEVHPQSPQTVMKYMRNQYNIVAKCMKDEISSDISDGKRFSVSLDEYTSLSNRRYMNVNLHSRDKFWNLGMIGLKGSMTAENIFAVLRSKLVEFGVEIEKHIINVVTDGASVMVKFGKNIPCHHTLCYAHTVHLAVCDVLYSKSELLVEGEDDDRREGQEVGAALHDANDSLELAQDDSDTESDQDNDEEYCGFFSLIDSLSSAAMDDGDVTINDNQYASVPINNPVFSLNEENRCISIDMNKVLQKVRKMVKIFKLSPLKNETLQKYVVEKFGHEKMLLLDARTRWNSLYAMIERFLDILTEVKKALIDLKQTFDLETGEIIALKAVKAAMEPMKLVAERLCGRNINLLSIEPMFEFLFGQLNKLNSPFALLLIEKTKLRLQSRTNNDLLSISMYLKHGKSYQSKVKSMGFNVSNKTQVSNSCKELYERLFCSESSENRSGSSSDSEAQGNQDSNLSLNEKLNLILEKSSEHQSQQENIDVSKKNRTFQQKCVCLTPQKSGHQTS